MDGDSTGTRTRGTGGGSVGGSSSGDDGERLGERVRDAFREEVDRTHQSMLNAAVAFTVTFGVLRGLTYGIRYRVLPFGNITTGTLHIHHYVWGIALLLAVGFFSLVVDTPRYNPALGAVYGTATALVVDEFALLLNLRDVYWAQQGRISVDVALTTIAVAVAYFAGRAFWKRLGHELLGAARRGRPQKERRPRL